MFPVNSSEEWVLFDIIDFCLSSNSIACIVTKAIKEKQPVYLQNMMHCITITEAHKENFFQYVLLRLSSDLYVLFALKLSLKFVCTIFIFSPNGSPSKNYEKCFFFHLKSSFCSRDIQFFAIFSLLFHTFQVQKEGGNSGKFSQPKALFCAMISLSKLKSSEIYVVT